MVKYRDRNVNINTSIYKNIKRQVLTLMFLGYHRYYKCRGLQVHVVAYSETECSEVCLVQFGICGSDPGG